MSEIFNSLNQNYLQGSMPQLVGENVGELTLIQRSEMLCCGILQPCGQYSWHSSLSPLTMLVSCSDWFLWRAWHPSLVFAWLLKLKHLKSNRHKFKSKNLHSQVLATIWESDGEISLSKHTYCIGVSCGNSFEMWKKAFSFVLGILEIDI